MTTTKPATPTELLIAVFAKSPADVELILQEVAAAVEDARQRIRHEFRDLPLIVAVIDEMGET